MWCSKEEPTLTLSQVQLAKEYYKPYLAATEPMFAGERQFTILKRKEGYIRYKEANFEGSLVGDFKAEPGRGLQS